MTALQDRAFRIAVFGEFSGATMHQSAPAAGSIANSAPLRIDRDNFDDVMRKLDVRLDGIAVGPGGAPVSIRFAEMDAFHPDRLYAELDLFDSLRDLRNRLNAPESFDQAATEVLSWFKADASQAKAAPQGAPEVRTLAGENDADQRPSVELEAGSLLDQIIEPSNAALDSSESRSEWQRVIDSIVAPYVESGADPRQAELIGCVDASIQLCMSALLHHPRFRALESAWRSLHMLVHRLETGTQLSIHLFDISKSELKSQLVGDRELRTADLYRSLVEQAIDTSGGEPWSLLLGNYTFGTEADDIVLLSRLAELATAAAAPLLTAADIERFDAVADPGWQALRVSRQAAFVGLTWPRFLLRLPYGEQTKPIDSFAFEEISAPATSEKLLWGNSAFIAGLLLGEAFERSGWSLRPGEVTQVTGLPVWIYTKNEETELHPCGERLISDTAAEHLRALGVTPLLSVRNHDIVSMPQIISLRGSALAGQWDL